jgi:hypothetical protein
VKEKRLPSPVPNAIKCLPLPSTDVRKKAINFLLTGHVEQAYNVKNSGKRGTANDEEKKMGLDSCFKLKNALICDFRKCHIELQKMRQFLKFETQMSGNFRKCPNPAVTKGVG